MTTIEPRKQSSLPGSSRPEPSEIFLLGKQALEDSKRWFPATADSVAFTVLAMAGEVGEVANIVKKIERGSSNWRDAKVRRDLDMEVADVFTYLVLLAGQLNIDLIQLYNLKRMENERRFNRAE